MTKASSAGGKRSEDREKLDARFAEIVRLTDEFCAKYLDAEYADLCRMVAENLRGERRSPILKGKPEGWAAGIAYTVGWVNFLSDPSQTPHMKNADLYRHFGVSDGTAQTRSRAIREIFDLSALDPRLTRRSMMDDNPLAWMVELEGGFIDDARRYSREVQEKLVESRLIPYVHPSAKSERQR